MFGYETKKETKEFDPKSPNGRLMAYVCFNLIQQAIAEDRERMMGILENNRGETKWGDANSNEVMTESINSYIIAVKDDLSLLDKPLSVTY